MRGLGLILIASVLAGCAQKTCRPGPYLEAYAVPPLEIPEGMDAPDRFMAMRVPDERAVPGRPASAPDGCFFLPPPFYAEHGEPNPDGLPVRPSSMPGAAVAARAAPSRVTQDITALLQDWAATWSRREFDAWVQFYDPDYTPEGYESNAAWRSEQRRLFEVPATTRIRAQTMNVTVLPNERVQARFVQEFGLGDLLRTVSKEIVLAPQPTGTGWMIVEDHVVDLL